jgi:hypothetical protein
MEDADKGVTMSRSLWEDRQGRFKKIVFDLFALAVSD